MREDTKMVLRVVESRTAPSMRTVAPLHHLDEVVIPSSSIHIRAFVRDLHSRKGSKGATVTPITKSRNPYEKVNGNVTDRLEASTPLFIPRGVNYRQAFEGFAQNHPDLFRLLSDGSGLVVRLPAGTEVTAYANFSHPDKWNLGEARCIATFFVDGDRLQLTIKSNGKAYIRTPRSR